MHVIRLDNFKRERTDEQVKRLNNQFINYFLLKI